MPRNRTTSSAERVTNALIGRLKRYSAVTSRDERLIRLLRPRVVALDRATDIVRQGDRPDSSVFLLGGMLARYHTLATGDRQYLSLHVAGDLPDLQSLFLQVMDHSLTTIDAAEIALFAHKDLYRLLAQAPSVSFAFWRQTLLDAAIFRQAITNNGQRGSVQRLAHMFCEQFVRASEAGIAAEDSCSFPLSQTQIGQLLGISLVSTNRAMQALRKAGCADLKGGRLIVCDWNKLQARADFDPAYLHLDLRPRPSGARPRART